MGDNREEVSFRIDFRYEEEENPTLKSVEGSIEKGKCIVLCGESGCGKTSLLRCINHLIPQFYEGDLKGYCQIDGQDLKNLSIGEVGQLAASVFQDPRSQFFTLNSSLEIAFGLENKGLSRQEIEKKVKEAYESFHLEYLADRDVFSLSSGERQLVAFLAAYAMDTELFLLDEPTANLDFDAVEAVAAIIQKLKRMGRTFIISEHRLYYLNGIADEYWFMENGSISKKFSAEEMKKLSKDEREVMGLRIRSLKELKQNRGMADVSKQQNLKIEDISFSYEKKGRMILNHLSLEAGSGEIIGLIGHNGCGKTSLGKAMTGLLKLEKGSIFYNNRKLSQKELCEHSIFIMQEAEFQFFTNSVMNELSYGRKSDQKEKEKLENLLKRMGLWEYRNQHPFTLSGGQMQRLVLLLAYLSPKPIVVLDEPTAGLDFQSLQKSVELIKEMSQEKIVFVITHDLELIGEVCSKALKLQNGRIGSSFDLQKENEFQGLCQDMKEESEKLLLNQENEKLKELISSKKEKMLFDPRTKWFLFILAMISGIGVNTELILMVFTAIMLMFLFEKRWGTLCMGILLMGLIHLSYFLLPGVITAFMLSFFPRMLIIIFGALLLLSKRDITGSLAVLRKLHVSEKFIMIFSVMFRFFPVLQKDMKLMFQSIETRGFFPKLRDKLRAVPEYLEVMIVPMVFRVIRIAEALSASAETRGIALQGKRDSYLKIEFHLQDYCMMIFSIVLFVIGVIL